MAASSKGDKPQMDFNLDKASVPDEARPYDFVFRGKHFRTADLASLDYAKFEKAWSDYRQTENARPVITLMLGADAKRFWEAKPSVFHVAHLVQSLEPVLSSVFGSPGESDDSDIS